MAVEKGRIRQSVAHWCFNAAGEHWPLETTCNAARELGGLAVELVDTADWPTLAKYGLICALTPNGMPGEPFVKGFNNLRHHEELVTRTKQAIDDTAAAGFPNVIAFTGYKWRDAEDPASGEISLDEGRDNCATGLKQVAGYAAQRGVTICLEQLNTRAAPPLRGHPGYQGDDIDYVASIARQVDSPALKLSFDVYHVQVMNGDVIHRLRENRDLLGHVQIAGVPGRGPLDDRQEINYPAIMRELLELGYDGYVGQEFLPTANALENLRTAVQLCDV